MRKTISIDLDGVLNTYHGNYDKNKISPIKEGAKEFLEQLSAKYKVEIFTVRETDLVTKWLEENHILQYISDITNIKNPYTSIFIDDRALNFNGDFELALKEINNFAPYWRNV